MINKDVIYVPEADIQRALKTRPTPFFIYEEKRLRDNCVRFRDTFKKHFPTFKPLYAVKANTNPTLLKIIFSEGFGADASSEPEAWIANKLGADGMYTGNHTTLAELKEISSLGNLLLNLDDISLLDSLKRVGVPEFLSFRINPGVSQGGMKSLLLAGPDAKYGVPPWDVHEAYIRAKEMGVKRFGMHMMTGSNVLDENYFPIVTDKLLEIAGDLYEKTGIQMDMLNIGGGFGMPYRPEEKSLDLKKIAKSIRDVFDKRLKKHKMPEPVLMAEPGRMIAADTGWLVAKVHVVKKSYKTFAGVDAGMNDLPRPAIYGAYHHITALNKPKSAGLKKTNVVGRLCEHNDQFAIDRLLPELEPGDVIAIHNAGAHSYAMGHNYNNRLRSAEYLIGKSGRITKIRRAETMEDLFATTSIMSKGK